MGLLLGRKTPQEVKASLGDLFDETQFDLAPLFRLSEEEAIEHPNRSPLVVSWALVFKREAIFYIAISISNHRPYRNHI